MHNKSSDVTKPASKNFMLNIVLDTTIRDKHIKNVIYFRTSIWSNQNNKILKPKLHSNIHICTHIQKPYLLTWFLNRYKRLYCSAEIQS